MFDKTELLKRLDEARNHVEKLSETEICACAIAVSVTIADNNDGLSHGMFVSGHAALQLFRMHRTEAYINTQAPNAAANARRLEAIAAPVEEN